MTNLSEVEARIERAAVLQAYRQPGIEVTLDVPNSERRISAKTTEIGVEFEIIENGEVIASGAVSNAWFRSMKAKGERQPS
jgi:hypothetical protein